MHGTDYVVQPLPVNHFAIREGKKKNTFTLNWNPVEDVMEPTAKPQGYIVYTRIGYGGFEWSICTQTGIHGESGAGIGVQFQGDCR